MRLLLSCLLLQSLVCFSVSNAGEINKKVLKKRCNFNGILRVNLDLNEYENNPNKFKYIYKVHEIEDELLSLYIDKGFCTFLANNYKKIGMKEDDDYYTLKEIVVMEYNYEKNIYDCIDKDNIIILKNDICILKNLPTTTTTTISYFTTITTTTTNTTTTNTTTTTTTTNTTTTTTTPKTTTTTNTTTITTTITTTTTNTITNFRNTTTNKTIFDNKSHIITDNENKLSEIHNINNLIISLSVTGTIILIVVILFLVRYKKNNGNGTYKTNEPTEEVISETQEHKYEEPNKIIKKTEYNQPNSESLYLEPMPINQNIHFNSNYEMDE